MFGPVMQRRRIEISARRPNKRARFRVYLDLRENRWVAQRSENLPLQNGLKIDGLDSAIGKAYPQRVCSCPLERFHSVNRMFHLSNSTAKARSAQLGAPAATL